MTINDALLSVYPDQFIGKSIRLGTKLFIMMDKIAFARGETSYWVAREDTTEIIFKFDTKGIIHVYNDINLTPHEKRVIGKIIGMWRDNMRPDWETFKSMRAHPMSALSHATLVPVVHNTP